MDYVRASRKEFLNKAGKSTKNLFITDNTDMHDFYKDLIDLYRGREEECPSLLLMESAPHAFRMGHALVAGKNQDLRLVLKDGMESIPEENIPLPVGVWTPDIYDLYEAGLYLSEQLGVRLPQLLQTTDRTITQGMVARLALRNEKELHIFIDANCDGETVLKAIAHEMRHMWQRRYHRKEYFGNYEEVSQCRSIIEYNMQSAEIDALAYASAFAIEIGTETFPAKQGLGPEIDELVNRRIVEILEDDIML